VAAGLTAHKVLVCVCAAAGYFHNYPALDLQRATWSVLQPGLSCDRANCQLNPKESGTTLD